MLLFTVRRLINSIFVLLASSFIVYLFAASQYDPLAKFRPLASTKPPGFLDRQAHIFGLDRPLLTRYWDWLSHLIRFDGSFPFISFNFGKDVYNAPVSTDLAGRMEVTMRMVAGAIILALIIAIVAGVISGVRKDKPIDVTLTVVTFVLLALPTFFFAALLKEFAIKSNRHLRDGLQDLVRPIGRRAVLSARLGSHQGPADPPDPADDLVGVADDDRAGSGTSGRR